MYTHPKNLSNGHCSGPGISFCGCGVGQQREASASCVYKVGTAPAQDLAGSTRETCGVIAMEEEKKRFEQFAHQKLTFRHFTL